MEISEIISLEGIGATSGEAFQVLDSEGRRFKLRSCASVARATRIERNVKHMARGLPQFMGRDRNYLLFEWVEGQSLHELRSTSIPIPVFRELGRLAGAAHALDEVAKWATADRYFKSLIRTLKKTKRVPRDFLRRLKRHHKLLRGSREIPVVLEIGDFHPRNFMFDAVDDPEAVRGWFVDEAGFTYRIKGLGLAKPLFTEKLIKTPEQLDAFWQGYGEFHSNAYFDADYQAYVAFVQRVRTLASKAKRGREISERIACLEQVMRE
jgi:hypothetical protein